MAFVVSACGVPSSFYKTFGRFDRRVWEASSTALKLWTPDGRLVRCFDGSYTGIDSLVEINDRFMMSCSGVLGVMEIWNIEDGSSTMKLNEKVHYGKWRRLNTFNLNDNNGGSVFCISNNAIIQLWLISGEGNDAQLLQQLTVPKGFNSASRSTLCELMDGSLVHVGASYSIRLCVWRKMRTSTTYSSSSSSSLSCDSDNSFELLHQFILDDTARDERVMPTPIIYGRFQAA